MSRQTQQSGSAELRAVLRRNRSLFWAVGLFSTFVNLLMLTGPIYMLQVYDRVLSSRSVETLLALTGLIAFLFLMMGVLDHARGRILARIGANFQTDLDRRVFSASLQAGTEGKAKAAAASGLMDLESVQRLLASPVLATIFDMPWTPVFLLGIWIFHPWLGMLAIVGGGVLIALSLLNTWMTRRPVLEAGSASQNANVMSTTLQQESEMVQSLGMQGAAFDRWQIKRRDALEKSVVSGDGIGKFMTTSRTLRMFLQSAMLGLGAYLVLLEELSPGAMIAGSILLGRALAPVDTAIGQWSTVQRARQGWTLMSELLTAVPPSPIRTALPRPAAKLEVNQLTVLPPGESQASLRMVSFSLPAGQAVGVIGPSGAGKTTLARALTGVWAPAGGHIRLDGATLDQYGPDDLGKYIGYLPQRVELFEGTIADNIAGLALSPDSQQVVTAAQKADAHDMILRLPQGYDTPIAGASARLSGGQIQRIGLARALFGDPVLLVLDEPNSNLDNSGSNALNAAIKTMKSEGKSVLIMAHRPAAIQECDLLLMLEDGMRRAFGPKEEVMRSMVKNHENIARNAGPGGVS